MYSSNVVVSLDMQGTRVRGRDGGLLGDVMRVVDLLVSGADGRHNSKQNNLRHFTRMSNTLIPAFPAQAAHVEQPSYDYIMRKRDCPRSLVMSIRTNWSPTEGTIGYEVMYSGKSSIIA